MENFFFFKRKTTGQIPNNFTIIKSITIILVYVSWLKKKSLLFSLLSHTLIIFLKDGNTLLSPFYFLFHAQLYFLTIFFSSSFSFFSFFLFSFFSCAAPFSFFFTMQHTKPNKPYLYTTQPPHHPSSTQTLIHLNEEFLLLLATGIIIQAHMWAFISWAGPRALCTQQ